MPQPSPLAYSTPVDVPHWQRWLLFSPLARIVWFAATFAGYAFGIAAGLHLLGQPASPLLRALTNLCDELVPAVIVYLGLVTVFERRRISELALRTLPTYGLAGLAAGAILFSAVVAVLWLVGSYHVIGTNPNPDWLPEVLVAGVCAGLAEEIMFRGVLFRICEEGMGTWFALAVSSALFGAVHLHNPAATWWSAAAIAIEAGLLLGLLYHLTRSLWACVGLHAAWNIMQGTVYGIPVSGTRPDGFLVSTLTGPDWLSGGGFGAEASVVALLLCSLCTAGLLVIAIRRGSIVPPFWMRTPVVSASIPVAPPRAPMVPPSIPAEPVNAPIVAASVPAMPVNTPIVPASVPTVPVSTPIVPAGVPTVPVNTPIVPAGVPAGSGSTTAAPSLIVSVADPESTGSESSLRTLGHDQDQDHESNR